MRCIYGPVRYVGSKCCKQGAFNEICGGSPKICETDDKFMPDAVFRYECEVQMSEAECTKKGGKSEGLECKVELDGIEDEAERKDKCATIGGTPRATTCQEARG